MNTLWEWICRYKVAITAVFAALAIGAAAVVAVISVSRRRARAAQAAVTATQTAEQTDATTAAVTTTELMTAPVTTALTAKTTRKTTVRTTTRRTVAPPPIVVEPDNVKDDTAKTPDASVTKPAATPDTKTASRCNMCGKASRGANTSSAWMFPVTRRKSTGKRSRRQALSLP